jgi:hypothetical protein
LVVRISGEASGLIGDVDVEDADRIRLERLPDVLVAPDLGKA